MYLVTGASGFIGKHLLDLLVRRGKPIYCLVWPSSEQGFRDLIDERWPSARSQIAVLQGDIGLPHIIDGIVHRKKRVATRLGIFGEVSYALVPKVIDRVLNTGYRLFPDSPAKGREDDQVHPGPEAVAFAYILHGIHW